MKNTNHTIVHFMYSNTHTHTHTHTNKPKKKKQKQFQFKKNLFPILLNAQQSHLIVLVQFDPRLLKVT